MTILNKLSEPQRLIICSLPYRVGLWVSRSDDSGGEDSDAQELQVLDNLIHGFAGQVFGSELLQYIMAETVAKKEQWPQWMDDLDDVPGECEMAVDILRLYVDEKDVNAYATRLIEIGEAVALAFREQEHVSSFIEKARLYLEYAIYALKTKKHSPYVRSFDEFLYISPHERKALNVIAARVGANYV